jgi:hypothetical protein
MVYILIKVVKTDAMSLLDNFLKDYNRSHYNRYPKSRIIILIIYAVLFVLLILAIYRAWNILHHA